MCLVCKLLIPTRVLAWQQLVVGTDLNAHLQWPLELWRGVLCTDQSLDRWQTACMQCVAEQFEQICYGRHKLQPTYCQLECTKIPCICTYCPPTRHVACLWCSESFTLLTTSHGGGEDQQPHQPFSISLGDTCDPKNYTSVTLVMCCPRFGA